MKNSSFITESFRAKVTAIEESKDLDEIKVQELIGSLQMYELSLPNQRKSKEFGAYLAKNFHKFLKFKNSEKFGDKRKFMSSGKEKEDFKRREGKESQSTQGVTCFECNGHGHFKK